MKTYIFLTGANSFLGKAVQQELKQLQNENFVIKCLPSSKELDLTDFDKSFNWFENKINNQWDYCRPYLSDGSWMKNPNYNLIILHMAALCGGIKANSERPADFFRDNMQMGLNIFEIARQFKIDYLYTIGTTCSYPLFCPTPFKEDKLWDGEMEPTNASYALAKKALLQMHVAYNQQYGLKGAHLIPANMYGPYDHFNTNTSHVIPSLIVKFIDAVENDKDTVECWGSGKATREFLLNSECAKAIVKAIEMRLDTTRPINIGSGDEISIRDLSRLIADIVGFQGKIVFNGEVSDGQPKRTLSTTRAKYVLDWENQVKLENGLKQTIEWYKENNKSGW
jgi:GDP-L-fucose synthase